MKQDWPRLLLTAVIVGYFGWALITHYSEGLEETLKNIVMLAIGFWLGSSDGSKKKTEQMVQRKDDEQ